MTSFSQFVASQPESFGWWAQQWHDFWRGSIGEWIITRGLRIVMLVIAAMLGAGWLEGAHPGLAARAGDGALFERRLLGRDGLARAFRALGGGSRNMLLAAAGHQKMKGERLGP